MFYWILLLILTSTKHQPFQDQTFTMLVIKKNLRVSERFPYPVRVEAVLELIDHFPLRKLEKITRKGSNLRLSTAKLYFCAYSFLLKVIMFSLLRPDLTFTLFK